MDEWSKYSAIRDLAQQAMNTARRAETTANEAKRQVDAQQLQLSSTLSAVMAHVDRVVAPIQRDNEMQNIRLEALGEKLDKVLASDAERRGAERQNAEAFERWTKKVESWVKVATIILAAVSTMGTGIAYVLAHYK